MLPETNKPVPGPAIVPVVKISGASMLLVKHYPACMAIGCFQSVSGGWHPLGSSHWIAHLPHLVILLCRSTGCGPPCVSNRLGLRLVARDPLFLLLVKLCLGLLAHCWTASSILWRVSKAPSSICGLQTFMINAFLAPQGCLVNLKDNSLWIGGKFHYRG